LFHCILLYFSLFYHVFYRITVIGWSALAVVSRYCQILLLLLIIIIARCVRECICRLHHDACFITGWAV